LKGDTETRDRHRVTSDLLAEHRDGPGIRFHEAKEAAKKHGFARAAFADEGDALAIQNVERGLAERKFGEVVDNHKGVLAASQSSSIANSSVRTNGISMSKSSS
jgi:hypothetical protein